MSIIIGISGKKQSGKSTLCNYLKLAICLGKEGYWNDDWLVDQDSFGNTNVFDKCSHRPVNKGDFEKVCLRSDSHCKVYSFADPIKQLVCKKILGMTHEQVYGTDEEKNSLTGFYWDNIPDPIRWDFSTEYENVYLGQSQREFGGAVERYEKRKVLRTGRMTAREVMQVVGTDIFRKMFADDVWVKAAFNIISDDNPPIALIEDVRFVSEVEAILKAGGYVIRLTRNMDNSTDKHGSEVDLDNYDFDSQPNAFLIDNADMEIMEKNRSAMSIVEEIKGKQYDH